MKEVRNEFNALTPDSVKDNNQIYDNALDYAFSNKNIKNIAITGVYGAGKSTIWKTYINKNHFQNVITTSLGKYEDYIESNFSRDKKVNEDNNKEDCNRIERQLINQMLSQIDATKIPLSKYKFKENKSKVIIFFQIMMTMFFILSIILWLLKDSLIILLKKLLKNANPNFILIVCSVLFLVPIAMFLCFFYRKNNVKISKVNLKGAEANFNNENNDETVLDRDIKEIVYLLNSSETKIVVFEDLDRYDNIEIFTKLRELNFLLNSYVTTNGDKRVIRFVYMLKDGLFFSKNRTKFFDFIIPIVPVVDSKTSENKLIALLKNVENPPDKSVLSNISLYIDDMRLLKNIVNEYIIYSNVIPLGKIELEKNKLFALITLKNIFPNEFDMLQKDRGYIRHVFDKLEKSRKLLTDNLEPQLLNIEERIKFIHKRFENDKFQVMALLIPADVSLHFQENKTWAEFLKEWSVERDKKVSIRHSHSSTSYDYEEFINRFVVTSEERKSIINKMPIDRQSTLNALNLEANNIKHEMEKVKIYSYKELIAIMTPEQRDELFIDDKFEITKDHYFPFVRFLIVDGLLDETYWYYKGNFDVDASETLKRNDTIYIKGLLEGKKLDVFLNVEAPEEIVKRLIDADFSRFNILNRNIMKYCLDKKLINQVLLITDSVDTNNNYFDLCKIIDTLEFETIRNYVEILLENKTRNILKILDSCNSECLDVFKNILIAICTSSTISLDKLELFSPYIEQNESIIDFIDEDEFSIFIKNISLAKIKFENLSETETNKCRLTQIEEILAYKLTVQNVIFISNILLEKKIEYSNLLSEVYQSKILSEMKAYIKDNYVSFISQYIDENVSDAHYNNSEKILLEVITSNISNEHKMKYVRNNKTTITNIQGLESISDNENIFNLLFDSDKIAFTAKNIRSYWNMIQQYCMNFINYIDRNINEMNCKSILENNKQMCNVLINDSDISDKLFDFILMFADEKVEGIDSKLSEQRVIN